MANIKFSQFTTAASLSATGQIVGFDGVNNIRLTKAALEGSLNLGNLAGAVDAGTQVIGTLAAGNGGTGNNTYVQGDILYADSGGGLSRLAAGTAGYVLTTNGAGADPSWAAGGGGGGVTSVDVSGGTTGLTFTGGPITTSGTITAGGTLAAANGGTGAAAPYLNSEISYRSMYRAWWLNNVSYPYGNVPRGTEYCMVTNVSAAQTTHPSASGITQTFTNSGNPTGTSIFLSNYVRYTLVAGKYNVRASGYFFDQTSDLDTQIAIWTRPAAGFGDTKYLLIDQKANETTGDRFFQGSILLNLTVDTYVYLTLRFDNGSADPFPQAADNRYGMEMEIIRLF